MRIEVSISLFPCPQIEGFWFTVLEDVTQTFDSESSIGNFLSTILPTPHIYLGKSRVDRTNSELVMMR